MCKILNLLIILSILITSSIANPTTTDFYDETTTITSIDDSKESQPIQTKSIYEMILTVKGNFTDDLTDKNSENFLNFSKKIDAELIYVIEEEFKVELPIGSFKVVNILPSNLPGYLYISILMEIHNEDADEWERAIENNIIETGKFVETEVIMQGFGWMKVKRSDLWMYEQHTDCQSDFCESLEVNAPSFPPTAPDTPEPSTCSPNEQIKRGSTSIFIFEDQNCVDHVKSQFSPSKSSKSCSKLNKIEEVDSKPSQTREKRQHFAEEEESEIEQTVVVVKKKGNKVFIEI